MPSSAISASPPRAAAAKYATPMGTRWAKEKAQAGGSHAFDLPTDPSRIGPWILGECIGKGASGRVKLAKHYITGELAAVKILPVAPLLNSRTSLTTAQAKHDKQRLGIDREITMMKLMNHPNIMRIYDVYEGEKELYLVLEYVEGGELFDFLVNRGRLPPVEALVYFKQIIYGLNYAHTFSIIHRDLKPENILIHTLNPPLVKIADWGMAAFAPPSLQLETSCGSPHYASPEIVNGEKYEGTATDIWSCGVILFALLTGRLPFDDKNVRHLLNKVRLGKYEMPTWIDPLARDLISRMLVVDVNTRITIPEILKHPWLLSTSTSPSSSLSQVVICKNPPLPPSPSTLATPLASPGHVDPELLASLLVIWGRHAGESGECIIHDLCSPAGEGTLAKAFYFLLGKYRDGVLAEQRRAEGDMQKFRQECESAFGPASRGEGPAIRPYIKRASTMRTSREHAYSDQLQPRPAFHNCVSSPTPVRASNGGHILLIPPQMTRASASSRSSSRDRPPSPIGPRQPGRPVSSQRTTGSAATAYTNSVGCHIARPSSRPSGPRRGNTYSYHPRSAETSAGFILEQPSHATKDQVRIRSRSHTTAPHPTTDVTMASPTAELQPIVPPRSSNAHLQSVMDEISQQLNNFAQDCQQGVEYAQANPRRREAISTVQREDKENDTRKAEVQGGRGRGLGLGGKEIGNIISSGVEEMKGKAAKTRPSALDFSAQKKMVDSCLESPIILSAPLQNSSEEIHLNDRRTSKDARANRMSAHGHPTRLMTVTSPVVGEFKGWFSNLFNWKTGHPHGRSLDYFGNANGGAEALFSSLDVVPTRVELERYLEDELGVYVDGMSNKAGGISSQGPARVQSSADPDSWRVLRCKVEEGSARSKALGLKPVRFRVEFSSLRGNRPLSDEHRSSLLSPDLLGTPKARMSSQSGSDFLSESTSASTHLTVMVLVQEKGSGSSFSAIWRLLRERYPPQMKTSRTVGPGHYATAVGNSECVGF
ncbi:Protein kinase domain-containing protein [Pleurotus pulmonarius]